MALPPQGTRHHSHHRDRSPPQAEAHVQDARRHSSPGLGPQMAQRPHRRVGVVSSQRCPCPGVSMPAAHSHSRFIHRRGPPTRTHVSGKRGKRSRMAGVRQSHPRGPGECSSQLGSTPILQPVPRWGRHPIPKESSPMGRPHIAILWASGQKKAMHWV